MDRRPHTWLIDGLRVEADAPNCIHPDRVFPLFDDESLLLAKVITTHRTHRVLDVGTGSGILALKAAQQGASVVAIDIGRVSVSCATYNARRNGLSSRIDVMLGDLGTAVRSSQFDLVVSNPPFLPTPAPSDMLRSSYAGLDGISVVEPLLLRAPSLVRRGGELLMVCLTLASSESSLLERLLGRAFGSRGDCFELHDVYGSSLPLAAFLETYDDLAPIDDWARWLARRQLDRLYYFVVRAGKAGSLDTPLRIELVTQSEFSGSWQARLRRYRAWNVAVAAKQASRTAENG